MKNINVKSYNNQSHHSISLSRVKIIIHFEFQNYQTRPHIQNSKYQSDPSFDQSQHATPTPAHQITIAASSRQVPQINQEPVCYSIHRKSLTCCSYSAAGTGGLAGSSVLVKVDNRPGSANSGSYATIADLEPLYARPCGSRASYYAASHVTHLSQVSA